MEVVGVVRGVEVVEVAMARVSAGAKKVSHEAKFISPTFHRGIIK